MIKEKIFLYLSIFYIKISFQSNLDMYKVDLKTYLFLYLSLFIFISISLSYDFNPLQITSKLMKLIISLSICIYYELLSLHWNFDNYKICQNIYISLKPKNPEVLLL